MNEKARKKIENVLIEGNKKADIVSKGFLASNNNAQMFYQFDKGVKLLYNSIEEQLKFIYQSEPLLKKNYDLNLDKQTIWDGVFSEMKMKDIPKITKEEIVSLVHKFAKEQLQFWLKPLTTIETSTVNNNLISILKPNQIKEIVNLVNEIKLFKVNITESDFSNLLNGTLNTKLSVNNNQNLASLFACLSMKDFICKEWQSKLAKSKSLVGKRGAVLTANTLAVSANNIKRTEKIYKQIDKVINNLSIAAIN